MWHLARKLFPWVKFFLTYDPESTLSKVKCPVLAINGEKDLQVPPKENLRAIEEALKVGGNQNYAIKELPNFNYLFQTAQTGLPAEYMLKLKKQFPRLFKIHWLGYLLGIVNAIPIHRENNKNNIKSTKKL